MSYLNRITQNIVQFRIDRRQLLRLQNVHETRILFARYWCLKRYIKFPVNKSVRLVRLAEMEELSRYNCSRRHVPWRGKGKREIIPWMIRWFYLYPRPRYTYWKWTIWWMQILLNNLFKHLEEWIHLVSSQIFTNINCEIVQHKWNVAHVCILFINAGFHLEMRLTY